MNKDVRWLRNTGHHAARAIVSVLLQVLMRRKRGWLSPPKRLKSNVAVNDGVALPRSVHLYPIPEDIIVIVPDYRGYDYIMLDDDRVAIVDPETYEVVDIIEIA